MPRPGPRVRLPTWLILRRIIGLGAFVALGLIGLAMAGVALPSPTPPAPLLPGVAETDVRLLVHTPSGSPPRRLAFLAVEPDGSLVATDQGSRSILHLDAATGRVLAEWGPALAPGVTLNEPAGIATVGGQIYVLDRGTPRIFRLDSTGHLLSTISLQAMDVYGLNGLAHDAGGNLYVADTGRNRVLVFAPGGGFQGQFGQEGAGLGQLKQPMAVAVAPDHSLFVADWENQRIEHFGPGLAAIKAWDLGFHPWGVAVDGLGRVYVPDDRQQTVDVFTPGGAPLGQLGGGATSPPLGLAGPRQVAFGPGPSSQLYVLAGDGIARVQLRDTPPPPQDTSEAPVDAETLLGLLVLLLVGAMVAERARHRRQLAHAQRERDVSSRFGQLGRTP